MFFLLRLAIRLAIWAVVLSPVLLPVLLIQREPLVGPQDGQVFDDIQEAAAILKRFDPRNMSPDHETTVTVRASDVSRALATASQRISRVRGSVEAMPDGISIRGTAELPIPEILLGKYVNVEATIAPSESELVVTQLSIGSLPIPAWIIKPVAIYALDWFLGGGKGAVTYASVRSVKLEGDNITVAFQPPANLVADVKAAASGVLKIDAETIRAYYANLIETGQAREKSLAPYLRNAFALARTRSEVRNPIEENRALILALALYFGDDHFATLLPGVRTPELAAIDIDTDMVTVQRRHDWVQHMTTSAGLAIASTSGISDFIGVAKEVRDTQVSEGFSFGDLAADRTGVRLAEIATASDSSARQTQKTFAAIVGESDFFPKATDLPEDLTEAEFKARFGDVDSPIYKAQVATIEERIAALPIFQ